MNRHSAVLEGLEITVPPGHDAPDLREALRYANRPLPSPPPSSRYRCSSVLEIEHNISPLGLTPSAFLEPRKSPSPPPSSRCLHSHSPALAGRQVHLSPRPTGKNSNQKIRQVLGHDVSLPPGYGSGLKTFDNIPGDGQFAPVLDVQRQLIATSVSGQVRCPTRLDFTYRGKGTDSVLSTRPQSPSDTARADLGVDEWVPEQRSHVLDLGAVEDYHQIAMDVASATASELDGKIGKEILQGPRANNEAHHATDCVRELRLSSSYLPESGEEGVLPRSFCEAWTDSEDGEDNLAGKRKLKDIFRRRMSVAHHGGTQLETTRAIERTGRSQRWLRSLTVRKVAE